jgi:hypothetical protein
VTVGAAKFATFELITKKSGKRDDSIDAAVSINQ